MTTTANLNVTKIDTAQAQKEVTANAAFDIFDAALAVKALTITDANYTLATTGAPAEWQYGTLTIAGTLTAARNIVCPTNKKAYAVTNDTTGGFAITFKTSAGSGVTIANGKAAIVFCDGTNVRRLTPDT